MSQRIILQPDGRFAVFSTIVNDFILLDATVEEVIESRVAEEREKITASVHKIAARLSKGEAVYHQFTTTWDETIKLIEKQHGPDTPSLRWIRAKELNDG